MSLQKELSGNLLGAPRAESDKMLEFAFVETHDFRALTNTSDFNFVVGRRGTGKSALFIKVSSFMNDNELGYIFNVIPTEYETLELQALVTRIADKYSSIRAITRVAWRTCLLMTMLEHSGRHYKFHKSPSYDYLSQYVRKYSQIIKLDPFKKVINIIREALLVTTNPGELPGKIASIFEVEKLHTSITDVLSSINKQVYFLFDGLDEGWKPEQVPTAIIGGLAASASDFSDHKGGIQVILFVRDNIFRALSYFDRDFSRNIEGNTLRLKWDDQSLLHLIANRLRKALDLSDIESDIKVWNRFSQNELKNRDGFISCLNFTLYRPRDLLVLLNNAFITASRSGRNQIIREDIDSSSKIISKERLDDLLKEYDAVFPSLNLFVQYFKGCEAFHRYGDIVHTLDDFIAKSSFDEEATSDFAILGSGKEAFFALYSVGFVGLENTTNGTLQFCHDGSSANIDATDNEQRTCIHPCYWKALNIQSEILEDNILMDIDDDEVQCDSKEFADIRTKLIGQLVSQLPSMPMGKEGQSIFEDWVFRTIQILFAGQLSNPESKANKDAVQRRDIVATNLARNGFWRRVREDYASRQIVFEVKNYESMKLEDIRQTLSYATKEYGKFIVIVNRNQNEGIPSSERAWIKDMWDGHNTLIFIIPASLLARCVSKLRSHKRFDYTDDQLNKRLDVFIRSYLSLKPTIKRRVRR